MHKDFSLPNDAAHLGVADEQAGSEGGGVAPWCCQVILPDLVEDLCQCFLQAESRESVCMPVQTLPASLKARMIAEVHFMHMLKVEITHGLVLSPMTQGMYHRCLVACAWPCRSAPTACVKFVIIQKCGATSLHLIPLVLQQR